ncbi:DUF397 domain-containing protein [Streptomyces hainanensis]|uniref:DUF397 domain-containing protein n=1 Tax=Streptomyces hainanensis TaxID=402648 RepID=A0A4R4TMR7_9ACTN|nr:DUF397 domain-containing protein [Streptomyces hainanensis]TDC79277.1 DUF397 domain-containing protein [Streptomyces hainanensis]
MSRSSLVWFKSSYSGNQGGECLEVALEWRKSSRSGSEPGDCVEVAACPAATVHVRDSKNRAGGALAVSAAAWRSLVGHLS